MSTSDLPLCLQTPSPVITQALGDLWKESFSEEMDYFPKPAEFAMMLRQYRVEEVAYAIIVAGNSQRRGVLRPKNGYSVRFEHALCYVWGVLRNRGAGGRS